VNAKERIDATVALEAPDRVPVAPLLDHYAATYTGITNAELMQDGDKRIAAVLRTMRALGPWDMTFAADTANASLLKVGVAARLRMPGVDLPPDEVHQFVEAEVLTPEDYDVLIDKGVPAFAARLRQRLYPEMTGFDTLRALLSSPFELRRYRRAIEAAGAQMAVGGYLRMPIEVFSLGRSMPAFALDLYDRPEKVKRAAKRFREELTSKVIALARLVGVPRLFLGLARTSPALLSPRHVEEFVWPTLAYIVNMVADAGMTVLLHCDTDWTRALGLLGKLPPRSCILALDGDTDIFVAKEVLGDRMCIMGDVPARLLAFGTKDQVLAYCRRLIERVGKGGGFILSSGCSIPANARAENVRAMAEAVEEWGWY
jgi:hypothetical protein